MAEVVPIHRPAVDHGLMLQVLLQLHGTSPADLLDRSSRDFSEDAKAVIRLSCADNPQHSNAVKALQNSHPVQRHFHYTFMVVSSPGVFEDVLLLNTGLAISLAYKDFDRPVWFISGTLADWRAALVTGCSEANSPGVRQVFNKLSLWFEKLGLGEIWSAYCRTPLKDGTFRLDGPR
jgi:hypothetical protein